MTAIEQRMLDRELKKGSAELIILSIVEPRARHGYEISKQIETQSAGQLKFHVASLYPLLYRLEERGWLHGRWVEKPGTATAPLLQPDLGGPASSETPTRYLENVHSCHGRGTKYFVRGNGAPFSAKWFL